MRSFAVAAIAGLVAATPMSELEYRFIDYVAHHGKSYGTKEEYEFRMALFAEVDADIMEFNSSEIHSRHGHNQFSDWTKDEKAKMLGRPKDLETYTTEEPIYTGVPDWATGVNWVTAGAVSPVKDQGQCGSCWAFSSTGALESAYHIAMHKTADDPVTEFSEQQLVDCVNTCFACNGGNQGFAFRYLESHNAYLEANYPYVSGTTTKKTDCTYEQSQASNVSVATYTRITTNSYTALQAALYQQPQSISLCAETNYFQTYTSGVLTNAILCGTTIDHGVLAVGYGVLDGVNYFLVKNSWSSSWGDQGYVRIEASDANNGEGVCGIQYGPLYPSV